MTDRITCAGYMTSNFNKEVYFLKIRDTVVLQTASSLLSAATRYMRRTCLIMSLQMKHKTGHKIPPKYKIEVASQKALA